MSGERKTPTKAELRQEVRRATELSVIFNFHKDEHDARMSANCVPDNSIVFLEAAPNLFTTNQYSEFFDLTESLARTRRLHGKIDRYERDKERLLGDLARKLGRIGASKSDTNYEAHQATLIMELLEKDCAVHRADYKMGTNDEQMKKWRDLININYDADDDEGYARSKIKAASESAVKYTEAREQATVSSILEEMHPYVHEARGALRGYQLTQQGKLRAYLVYGSAHRYSLPEHFTAAGIEPEVIELQQSPERKQLKGPKAAELNQGRSLAYHALFITGLHTPPESKEDFLDRYYPPLEHFNSEENQQELDAFIVHCLRLRQTYERGLDASPYIVELMNYLTELSNSR